MTKKQIKKLVAGSYSGNNLNELRVRKIADKLTRENLKKYLKSLKNTEKQKRVTIVMPNIEIKDRREIEKMFKKTYKDKKISFITDPSLILGLKIINNDLIYELSLNDTFDKINEHLLNQYD
ncbi:MAG: F0F1 ATP synthase subunit delta [Candidatus Levyibacteriota bacterium]